MEVRLLSSSDVMVTAGGAGGVGKRWKWWWLVLVIVDGRRADQVRRRRNQYEQQVKNISHGLRHHRHVFNCGIDKKQTHKTHINIRDTSCKKAVYTMLQRIKRNDSK